jgi:hypothetical protein
MDAGLIHETKKNKRRPQTIKGRRMRKVKKGLTQKKLKIQTGSGFFSSIFSWFGGSDKAKFYEFKKKLSRNLSDIEVKKKHVEQLANTYKSYSEDRLKVVNELIVVMRAEKIFPELEKKILDRIKIEQTDSKPGKTPKEYKAELSDARNKVKELEAKHKSLIIQDKTLYDKLKTYKKNYEEEFKKVEKYMTETYNVQDYYAKNIQKIDTELDRSKKDYDETLKTPPKERTSFQKKAIKKFKKYEPLYKLFYGEQGGLQPKQKLDQLTRQKDDLSNLRKDMEHYNLQFENLAPQDINKWQDHIEDCVKNISLSINAIKTTKKKLKKMLAIVNRLYSLTALQQMIDYSKKFEAFKKPLETCISTIDKIDSTIKDVEVNFYNLIPAARLDFNLQNVLVALKMIATLLQRDIQIYINDDKTRFEYMSAEE